MDENTKKILEEILRISKENPKLKLLPTVQKILNQYELLEGKEKIKGLLLTR